MSDVSIWLSVDPRKEKYPYQSPYTYCGWNPIKIIDPDGRDEWEINEQGKVTKHIQTKAHDAFYIVDKDGKRIEGKSLSFKYGTVKSQFNASQRDSKGKPYNMHFFKMQGDKNSRKALEFFHNNTNVEWSQSSVGKESGDKGINYLSNSEIKDSEAGAGYLFSNGYFFREHVHSHPYDYIPSNEDMEFAKSIIDKFGNNVPTSILFDGFYFEYTEYGYTLKGLGMKIAYDYLKSKKK
jgi:hypothetical protein